MIVAGEIDRDIRRVIEACFGRTPPWGAVWTKESVQTARSLVTMPMPGVDFVVRIAKGYDDVSPRCETHTIAHDEDWTGNAWAAVGHPENSPVSYVLCVSGFYPIATMRPCSGQDPGDGLDRHWPAAPPDSASQLDAFAKRLAPLCEDAGFHFADYRSPAIQQRLRFGWVGTAKAWDYLFYFGVPTG